VREDGRKSGEGMTKQSEGTEGVKKEVRERVKKEGGRAGRGREGRKKEGRME
jgi:hypothetical protein